MVYFTEDNTFVRVEVSFDASTPPKITGYWMYFGKHHMNATIPAH
jgi:hypothetical protein